MNCYSPLQMLVSGMGGKHLLIFATTLCLAATLSAEERIYSWVDANGVKHFSNQPPDKGTYNQMRIKNGNTLLTTPMNQSASQPTPATEADKEEQSVIPEGATVTTVDPEVIEKNCEAAKQNIFVINARHRIIVTDTDGTERRLDDDERLALLDESQQYIDENCQS